MPNFNSTTAWAVSSTPNEDTSFASGDAVRSGRNTSSSVAVPNTSTNARAMTSAGAVDIPPPIAPVRSAQKAYPPTMAIAPAARLITPDPR